MTNSFYLSTIFVPYKVTKLYYTTCFPAPPLQPKHNTRTHKADPRAKTRLAVVIICAFTIPSLALHYRLVPQTCTIQGHVQNSQTYPKIASTTTSPTTRPTSPATPSTFCTTSAPTAPRWHHSGCLSPSPPPTPPLPACPASTQLPSQSCVPRSQSPACASPTPADGSRAAQRAPRTAATQPPQN